MTTCKDCFHYEACCAFSKIITAARDVENGCEHFKNRNDVAEVPCKIGDFVWAIRNFKGKKHPQRGIVSDMYFLKDMSLQIVVKYVARGKWGETVFATDKEAYAAIEERKKHGQDR